MQELYLILTGPVLYLTFIIFFGGFLVRAAFYWGLSLERDKLFWDYFSVKWSLRSICCWIFPLGSLSFRKRPFFGVIFFVFHFCLIIIPVFLNAHNVMLEEFIGIRFFMLPNQIADLGTLVLIFCVVFLFLRRIILPEVRLISSLKDYCLLLITVLPFITGYLAYNKISDEYMFWLVLHVLSGEILLIVLPFSKLGHLMLFFFTRAFIASDMGARRNEGGRLGTRTW